MKRKLFLLTFTGLLLVGVLFVWGNQTKKPQGPWTLELDSARRGKTEIDGYKTSRECIEKALELTDNDGDYYICGRDCVYNDKTVDGIMCNEYCGRAGCFKK